MAIDAAAARAVATEYLARHQAKDSAGVAALFAEDAKVWDPVDSEPHVGRAAVEAFFTGTHQMAERMEFKLTGDVRVAGNHIAFPFQVESYMPNLAIRLSIIDTMLLTDDGLISEMRAYWNFGDAESLDA